MQGSEAVVVLAGKFSKAIEETARAWGDNPPLPVDVIAGAFMLVINATTETLDPMFAETLAVMMMRKPDA